MKKLIIINLILIIIIYLIPTIKIEDFSFILTQNFTIENTKEEQEISSRSGEERKAEKIEHISEQGLNLLKVSEGCDYIATRKERRKISYNTDMDIMVLM